MIKKIAISLGLVALGLLVAVNLPSQEEAAPTEIISDKAEDSLVVPLVDLPVVEKKNTQLKSKIVRRLNLDVKRTILIQGPIGLDSTQVSLMIKQLNGISPDLPIFLLISSPGGSVLAGADIINAINESSAPIVTICRILCASMASMIHQHGDKRFVTDRTQIMFHPASTMASGKVNEIVSYINSSKRYIDKIEIEVAERLGLTHAQYEAKAQNEWWIDSDDALKAKAVDAIVSIELDPALFEAMPSEEMKNKKEDSLKDRRLIWIFNGDF
jgi:ATP-dependent Clp protease protease subunit